LAIAVVYRFIARECTRPTHHRAPVDIDLTELADAPA
jgi:hypothetical protein